jgi:hypothetical protein
MHAEQLACTPHPHMDGEKEHESVYRNYPHPPPMAIEDLSVADKEILQSVSIVSEEGEGGGNCCYPPHLARISPRKLTACFPACALVRPTRSYKEVAPASRNAVEKRAGMRPSLTKRGFHCHRPRAWSSAVRAPACSLTGKNQRWSRS